MNTDETLQDIREHAELMARGTESERRRSYNHTRHLVEDLQAWNRDRDEGSVTGDRGLIADRLNDLNAQLHALSILNSSQALELDQYWAWVQVAIDNVALAIKPAKS